MKEAAEERAEGAKGIRFTARDAGHGTVVEVRHGSSYGTPRKGMSEVAVRHGPAPKKQKPGSAPVAPDSDPPVSRLHLPYEEAKELKPGQRVTLRVERA
jgi:hypothetical protein